MSTSKELPYLNNPITSEDMKKIDKIFAVLEADNQAYDFLEPVDYVGLGILDYPQIIKTPMDLGTVKTKLKDNKYNTFQEFLSDIDLIWTNCKTYNMAGSEIVKMAIHCEKVFKKQMEKQFKNYIGVKERVLKNTIKEELKITEAFLRVIFRKLKSTKFIVDNKINIKFIPKNLKDDDTMFQLLFFFDLKKE